MPSLPAKTTSTLAAILIAGLTLAVFGNLQNYGPESTIRRFHETILAADEAGVRSVFTHESTTPNAGKLIAAVAQLLRAGGRYQFVRIYRDSRNPQVWAEAEYVMPDGARVPVVWIVRKQGKHWRIDADATVAVPRGFFGF